MMVHFDWAISRQEPISDIQSIGREIERMEEEMKQIEREIELLERNRFSFVPLTSVKGHHAM